MAREYSLEDTRNIGIIAHIDAGKTTVTERILYYTGKKHKLGEVHKGEAEMDWMEQEKERGITITSAATTCFWKSADWDSKTRINIIDTPGHIDFTAEVQRSLRVLDGGVIVFDGVAGVEPQTETVWHQAEKFEVPRMCFINKMDRTGADFYADLDSIHDRLTTRAYPLQLPVGVAETFVGIIDLFKRKAYIYKDDMGKVIEETDVPEDMKDKVEEYRSKLIEAIVENDEELMSQYLDGKEPEIKELKRVLRQATINNELVPVLVGSALKNKGVQFLLDAVVEYLPSPLDIPPVEGTDPSDGTKKIERKASDDEPFAALAFKIATDPYVGKLSFIRIYSGVLKAGSYVLNTTTGKKERVSRIVRMHANNREEVDEIYAGEIAAAVGLKETKTGDTLCAEDDPIVLENISFPEPVIFIAIEPKTKADQEKMAVALGKLTEEDPTFRVKTDEETGQTVISGMGELHLDIIVDRLRREFDVEANIGNPQVAYRETIKNSAEAQGKYIKQSGGRGQYGDVKLRVEKFEHKTDEDRDTHFEFVDEVKGGNIPKEYMLPIQKGVKEAMDNGVIAGYQLIDIKVTVYDGSYHDVDSSEAAFKVAGSMALQEAVRKATPILLEPVMSMEAITPEDFMGDVVGDLNSKRAQIQEMIDRGNMKVIKAEVPLAEMFGYATQLRSMTQGRASYSMEFARYSEVPHNVAEEIKEKRGTKTADKK